MKYSLVSITIAFCLAVSQAFGMSSVSIPGQSMTCDDNDHYWIWKPSGCPSPLPASALGCITSTGGGSWPTSDFTIWGTNYTVFTSDPNAAGVIGILGTGGDTITPNTIGQTFVRQLEGNDGRPFAFATDRIDFHVLCASGKYANINAAIEYSVP